MPQGRARIASERLNLLGRPAGHPRSDRPSSGQNQAGGAVAVHARTRRRGPWAGRRQLRGARSRPHRSREETISFRWAGRWLPMIRYSSVVWGRIRSRHSRRSSASACAVANRSSRFRSRRGSQPTGRPSTTRRPRLSRVTTGVPSPDGSLPRMPPATGRLAPRSSSRLPAHPARRSAAGPTTAPTPCALFQAMAAGVSHPYPGGGQAHRSRGTIVPVAWPGFAFPVPIS